MLTRYKFEILRFLEKNGLSKYTHRQLSDSLTISNAEITDDMTDLINEQLVN